MQVGKKHYRGIWLDESDDTLVRVIDQRRLPFEFREAELRSLDDACLAISEMIVRGAPLIGATGSWGIYLAVLNITSTTGHEEYLRIAANKLIATRPTAVNLEWAVEKTISELAGISKKEDLITKARKVAEDITSEEAENSRMIGVNGLPLLRDLSHKKGGAVINILTHCNAGWLATVDYGTALAPVYLAHQEGIDLHVWVDETRPRNQGSRLTCFELQAAGVPNTLITDNAGGLLMQKGMVDIVITGSDRTALNGDAANKIGTYLKALAAFDNNVPFYIALPTSTIDISIEDGVRDIPVEQREAAEVLYTEGWSNNALVAVLTAPEGTRVSNFGFDITPARYITGLITEKGVVKASKEGIMSLLKQQR